MHLLRTVLTLIAVCFHGANGLKENIPKDKSLHFRDNRLLPGNRAAINKHHYWGVPFQTRHFRYPARFNGFKTFTKKKELNHKRVHTRSISSKSTHASSIAWLTKNLKNKIVQYNTVDDGIVKRETPTQAFDLGFVVDGSKAIDDQGTGNFRKCLEFVKEVLRSFPVSSDGVHAGLITYGKNARLNVDFSASPDQSSIEAAIDTASYPGTESYTGNALGTAMAKLYPQSGRQNVPHMMVLLSGSKSQDEFEESAEELKAGGVKIFCIGVGGRYDISQLDLIASSPSDTYVITTEFDSLRNVVPILVARINEVLSEPTGKQSQPPPDILLTAGGIVEAKINLGFLIDGSDGVGGQNYRISLDFIKTVYGAFWTQFGSLHLGLMVFGTDTRLIFDFDNTYKDKTEINNAIDSAAFPGGRTVMIGEALKLTETHLFGSKHHDSYRRILVVIMGSTSDDDVFLGAEILKVNTVKVFCVGVGNGYERTQLDGIASQPSSDNVFTVATYPSLESLKQTLIDKIEEARTVYIPPEDPAKRFQRYANQTGKPPGQTGKTPGPARASPTSNAPVAPQKPSSAILPTRPVRLPGGQSPPPNRPKSPGQTGEIPPAGASPTANAPVASKKPSSVVLPTRPVKRPGGQPPPPNRPKSPGQTGQMPPARASPTSNAPVAPQKPSSVILPTRPEKRPGGQSPPPNRPKSPSQTGQIPPEGASPTSKAPVAPQKPSSVILPTRLEKRPGGQPSVNPTLPNRPTVYGSGTKTPTQTTAGNVSPLVLVEDGRLDLVFLLDGSTTMPNTGFQAAKVFIKKLYSNFPIGEDSTHVGFVIYGQESSVVFNLIQYPFKENVDNKLLSTAKPNSNGNLLGKGLATVKQSVYDVSARPGGHQVLVVLAGGKSLDDVKSPSRALRDHGVSIFCIGIGDKVDVNQLRKIASSPEEEHLSTTTPEQLGKLLSPMVQNIRKDITDSVAFAGPADVKMELGFLLDVNSNNFRSNQFANVLNSVKSTYAPFIIGKDKTRIGIVTYGERPQTVVSLDQLTPRQSLDTAVDQIVMSPQSGPSLLGQGLATVSSQLFYGKSRPETPKILVVITGGTSRDDVIKPSAELKRLNTTIFCVGIGQNIDKNQLQAIATSPTSDHVIQATISHRETAGGNIASRIKKAVQVDLGFLVDGSGNVLETEFMQYMDIVKYIYSAFPISPEDVHVGLGVISTNPEIIFSFDKYFDKASLDSAVNSVEYPGSQQVANIGQSLTVAKEAFYSKSTRKGVRQVLVLLINSKSKDDISNPARRLRDSGVEMFCFSVGNKVDTKELAEIATSPANKHIVVNGPDNLPSGARKLVEKLGIAKVESDQKQTPKQKTPQGKSNAIDLVILIEGSDNTKPGDFQQVKEIVKSIYNNFDVSQNGTHVAVAIFAEGTQIVFNLNKHYDLQGMDNDINAASYLPGASMTGSALGDVKSNIFDKYSRKNVPKVLITVMTGKPNDDIQRSVNELKMGCTLLFALGLTSSYSPQSLDLASGEPHSEYVLISETFPEASLVAKKMADKIKKVVSVAKSRSERSVKQVETRLDIVFIVTNCGNNPGDVFHKQLDVARNLIHSLPMDPKNTRNAIISVSSGAKIIQDLNVQPSNSVAVPSAPPSPGGLCTFGKGMEATSILLKDKGIIGVPQVLIIFMAGKSDDDVSVSASDLHKAGVLVYLVGLKDEVNEPSIGEIASDPVSEYFISSPGIPAVDSTKQALLDKLGRVIQIGNRLVCPPNETVPSSGSQPQPESQNATKPALPSPRLNKTKLGPVDLVFLIEGSDAVNNTMFRTMLDIVKETYSRFPVSLPGTHVALVVYGTNVQIEFNLRDHYNSSEINDVMALVPKPTGHPMAGKALTAVKNDIYDTAGRTNDTGVSRVLLHIMCSKSLDDVIQPARALKESGVKIVAAGACPESNKAQLCSIGSPPLCNNSVLIKKLTPPAIPGSELAAKLKEGVPVQKTQPSGESTAESLTGTAQPNMFWNGPPMGAVLPLVPSLLPVHPQALGGASNIWNYVIPIQRDPVAPDPFSVPDNSLSYSTACVDYDPACSGYGVNGYCNGPAIGFSDDYLMKMCKKSCGFCKTDQDFTSSGIWLKKSGIPKSSKNANMRTISTSRKDAN